MTLADKPITEQRSTHFNFEHPVFRTPDARFLVAVDGAPSMAIKLADLDAYLPLKSLRIEFSLDDTPDGALLDKVIAGLKYVKVIRPGDSIPRELLDGSASWCVQDHHLAIAKGRITFQITSWLTGNESVVVDQNYLLQIVDDPLTKAKVNEAIGDIAERLGLSRDKRQDVLDRIDIVARELSYIEALRERFGDILSIKHKIGEFMKIYRRDRSIHEELVRIDNLIRKPIAELTDIFDQVDAQSGEIISLLKNWNRQISFIRESRDDLHVRMMLWDETLGKWSTLIPEKSIEKEASMRELYRFLARHFIIAKQWQLAGAAFDRKEAK